MKRLPCVFPLLFAMLLTAQTPSPAPSPTLGPNDLLFRALDRLRSYGTPPYVVYLAEENGETHRIAFRGSDEMMNDAPYLTGKSLPPARIYRAFVGPLSISVHEAIATPTPSGEATAAPVAPSNLESMLKTIAVVSSHGRLYDVHVSGTENVDGHQAYRIRLRALRDPERNAIRDFWIDTTTYDVLRADYVYVDPPDVDVPGAEADLTVNFETVGNYRIAAHWIAIYHLPGARQALYRELRITKMRFPETLPPWLFDARLYLAHRHAGEPDYLAGVL